MKKTIRIRKNSPITCVCIMLDDEDESGEEYTLEIEISGDQKIASAKAYCKNGDIMRCEEGVSSGN